ncbi:lipase 1 isoform X1 [Drosophila willistoni]|uniref:lipase 1 isoform X1 n=1 Tax=Drosophila willistoni TaxID=7260 RepID=UPI000C26D68C|nr:lipase 1 isoform X1 [Drosophila willistoni]
MQYLSCSILQIFFFLAELKWTYAGYLTDNFPQSVIEDGQLTTLQLLAKYKHPGESHDVTTEDKYILTMHRIPRPKAKPVLLVHGLQDSSATWILMGPESGLGYYLYANGYDVWMGNVRGNRYSRNHVKYNASADKAYWTFSWHEIGYYDIPAMIDTVLGKTGYQKLSYFGHSQGTTTFFVMASTRPEYNAKVHSMSALAPVAFMGHVKAPLLPLARMGIVMFGDFLNNLMSHGTIATMTCTITPKMFKTCLNYFYDIVGKNTEEFNTTMFPVVLGHLPAGCNIKQLEHYIQLKSSQRFCQFDYEAKENQRIYGRPTAPDYPLEKVTAPIALYYAQNDYLSSVEDVQKLIKILPNVVENNMYPQKKWNHMDMVWGLSSRRLAQPKMLKVMQLWENGGPGKNNEDVEEEVDAKEEDPEHEEVPETTEISVFKSASAVCVITFLSIINHVVDKLSVKSGHFNTKLRQCY